MKLVHIGHACWWVETADVSILFDPLLYDPNQCACYEIHPTRRLDHRAFREVDVVVVSHRHIDHFDVQSLCALPRSACVICPSDALIVDALRSIGFEKIRTIAEWERVSYGATDIIATPSTNPVPEFGFIVSDGSHTVWNQVDTQLGTDTARIVNQTHGRLDVVIAPWQPLLELKFQLHENIAFPHKDYAALIERAAACDTRMLVPGACGFRYGPRSSWLNRVAFPVARSRFVRDVQCAKGAEETIVVEMDPGDEIICGDTGPSMRPQACDFASSAPNERHLVAFCPVDPFQSLFREGPCIGVQDSGLCAVIDDLDAFMRRSAEVPTSPLAGYVKWKVVYQLIVCLERGNLFVSWDFSRDARRVDERSAIATATCIISEESLTRLAAGTRSWEEAYHSGQWRFFQSVAAVSGTEYSVPAEGEIVDIMQLRYPYQDALDRHIASEVARWRNARD